MKKNKTKNRNMIIIGIVICIVLVIGISFAFYSYNKTSSNVSTLVAGDVYMKYSNSNEITIDSGAINAMPSTYFQFTVEGKNTNATQDVNYNIMVSRGANHATRTERVADQYLVFTLMEVIDGTPTPVVSSRSYSSLASSQTLWSDIISRNTTSNETHTYRLYAWIGNGLVVSDTETGADYSETTWKNNVYATVKVTVTGNVS